MGRIAAIFDSERCYYDIEKSGKKPCTVRKHDHIEMELYNGLVDGKVDHVVIKATDGDDSFIRKITSVCIYGDLMIICWHPDDDGSVDTNDP